MEWSKALNEDKVILFNIDFYSTKTEATSNSSSLERRKLCFHCIWNMVKVRWTNNDLSIDLTYLNQFNIPSRF